MISCPATIRRVARAEAALVVFALVFLGGPQGRGFEPGEMRTWTDSTGQHGAEAAFLGLRDGQVELRKKDGPTIRVALDKLSQADQAYVERVLGGQREPIGSRRFTFINEQTGEMLKGRVVRRERGKRRVLMEKLDGRQEWIHLDDWKIAPESNDDADLDVAGHAAGSELVEVEAVGLGLTPDAALQNAYSNAIEYAVGALVDAETLVKNEKLIRETIFVRSQGFIQEHRVVSREEREGQHVIRIRASVKRGALAQRLKEHGVAVAVLGGMSVAIHLRDQFQAETNASKKLRDFLGRCTMQNLFTVKANGKHEAIQGGEDTAGVRVQIELKADLKSWAELSENLTHLLAEHAVIRRTLSFPGKPHYPASGTVFQGTNEQGFDGSAVKGACRIRFGPGYYSNWRDVPIHASWAEDLGKRLESRREEIGRLDYMVILLLRNNELRGQKWDLFVVPERIADAPFEEAWRRYYRLHVVLTDQAGVQLASGRCPLCNGARVFAAIALRALESRPSSTPPSPALRDSYIHSQYSSDFMRYYGFSYSPRQPESLFLRDTWEPTRKRTGFYVGTYVRVEALAPVLEFAPATFSFTAAVEPVIRVQPERLTAVSGYTATIEQASVGPYLPDEEPARDATDRPGPDRPGQPASGMGGPVGGMGGMGPLGLE